MSRTILALCAATLLSGCQCMELMTNRASIMTARAETLGPQMRLCRSSRGCDDCTPHRPYTCGYHPCWDDMITQHTAHKCAFRDLKIYRQQCGDPISHHFKMGFIQAYEDLAMNRQPSPPVIPPEKYWNAYYRSCAGQPDVDEWFAGYDAGLDMGCDSGVSRFNEIYLNRGCDDPASTNRFSTGATAYNPNQPVAAPASMQTTVPIPGPMVPSGQQVYPPVSNFYSQPTDF
jgi:hypothetical protein